MLVRVVLPQQAQTANPSNQSSPRSADRAERPERPERPEQPERPERPASPDVAPAKIIVRGGVPAIPAIPAIPPIPSIEVHTGGPQDMIPPQVVDISYAFFAMVAVILIGWPLSRAFGKRLERNAQSALSPAVGEQLQRIEQAVDAMAIEVERISEAQRYFTKLQTGQLAEPSALPGERR
jgi:hypothetical protein